MKICSNNQQAEFFIALESAELIISDFFLEEIQNSNKIIKISKKLHFGVGRTLPNASLLFLHDMQEINVLWTLFHYVCM